VTDTPNLSEGRDFIYRALGKDPPPNPKTASDDEIAEYIVKRDGAMISDVSDTVGLLRLLIAKGVITNAEMKAEKQRAATVIVSNQIDMYRKVDLFDDDEEVMAEYTASMSAVIDDYLENGLGEEDDAAV
jgi:hypothetical protein